MKEKHDKKYVIDDARLMSEWDWKKNRFINLDPSQTTINSHAKAYWLCPKGHSFQAAVSNRTRGSKCTVCLNRIIIPGINDLQTLDPHIAKEWNFDKNGNLLPTMVARSANKKVWWKCPQGHEYEAVINHRANGNGCPICVGKKVLVGYNDLNSQYPDIMLDWDYDKNIVSPTELTKGSQVRPWWKCRTCGHNWQTSVSNRVRGTGCPVCSKTEGGRKHRLSIVESTGSLADRAPDIAKEWHPTKNDDLRPTEFPLNSGKRVWWLCSNCGFEWQAVISNRANRNGCPQCSKQKFAYTYRERIVRKTGSLIEKEPEIAAEWHPTKNEADVPEMFSPGSGKVVWWKCKNGHEWQTAICTRTSYRTGCPICYGRMSIKGVNDLVTTHPEIAAEWHVQKNGKLKPEDFKIGSDKIVWWKCRKGHEWQTNIYHRQETGCPECIKERFTSFPEQAIFYYLKTTFHGIQNRYMFDDKVELDIFIPDYQIAIEYDGSRFHNSSVGLKRDQKKYMYLHERGIFLIRIKEEMSQGYTENTADVYLGYSDNKHNRNLHHILADLAKTLSVQTGLEILWDIDIIRDRQQIYQQYIEMERNNSIAIQYPHLVSEWMSEKNGSITPFMVTKGSEKVFWWRCTNGHEFQSQVKQRVRTGCPYCTNVKVLSGYNDLATTHPKLAQQWIVEKNDGVLPTEIIGGKQIAWWKCGLGHEWQASIDSRKRGNGCPICAGKQTLVGFNDLSTTNPKIAAEWNHEKNIVLKPTDVVRASNKTVWWKCSKGHEWQAKINSRTKPNGNGCPVCANQRVLIGYNDLQSKFPHVASQWNCEKNQDLKPTDVVFGSTKSVWWICEQGHEWKTSISNRTRNGSGCPKCSKKKR